MSSTQKNVVGKAKGEYTTTITVGGTDTTIQVTGTKVAIPASFGRRRPKTETGNKSNSMDKSKTGKAQKNDATTKPADTKPTPYYGEHYWAYGGEDTGLEDEDFEDISERGAEEYGA